MDHENKPGFIYVVTNPSMPGLAKVGRTQRTPYLRLAELNQSTSTPEPFHLVAA